MIYFETIKKNPKTVNHKPGWWFIRFTWKLKTKYAKRIKQINKEWEWAVKRGLVSEQYRRSIVQNGYVPYTK